MIQRKCRVALAFGAAASLASMALADEVQPDAVAMPEVVVSGQRRSYRPEKVSSPKYTEPLRDIPQSITVIPQSAMQEQGATSLRDVLKNVPGISIQAGEGGVPAGDNLSLRGFNARTDLFIDGIRDFGGYSRDSFNLEAVEVTKGPSSFTTGRGSTGGSINMVSKYPGVAPSYYASYGIGTDAYHRGTIDVNQPLTAPDAASGSALRVNAMWHQNEVPGREIVDNERWGLAPSVTVGLGTPTRLTLGYFYLSQNNTPDYGIPWVPNTNTALPGYGDKIPPVDYGNYYGLVHRDFEKVETNVLTQKTEHDFSDMFQLNNIIRYGKTDRDSVTTSPRFNSNNSTNILRQFQSRDQVDTIIADQLNLNLKFNTLGLEHGLVTGAELSKETSKNFGRSAPAAPLADLYNPNPYDPFAGGVARTGSFTETTADSMAFYAFDTLKVAKWLDLMGGVRWDSFDVDYSTISANSTPALSMSRKDDMTSWRAGFLVRPADNGSVYVTYGTSFNPSAEALTLANTATAVNNVNTAPEKNTTYEVGTKWDLFRKRLAATAAIFRTDKTNARTEDPANPADVVVLEGEQRVDGFEIGIGGYLMRKLNVFGGYTYLDSKVLSSKNPAEVGRELANTPQNSFSFWGTYDLPANLQIGAGGQFVDERYNSTTTPRLAPSYWTVDAMLAWNANKNITFRLNGYNLTNEKYIGAVGGGHVIPGAERSAVLTTEVKF